MAVNQQCLTLLCNKASLLNQPFQNDLIIDTLNFFKTNYISPLKLAGTIAHSTTI
jgi:hypothetical protein